MPAREPIDVVDSQGRDLGVLQFDGLIECGHPKQPDWDFGGWLRDGYFSSEAVAAMRARIYSRGPEDDLGAETAGAPRIFELGGYCAGLGYSCLLGEYLGRYLPRSVLLRPHVSEAVVVAGFHDGDWLEVGRLTASGWTRTAAR